MNLLYCRFLDNIHLAIDINFSFLFCCILFYSLVQHHHHGKTQCHEWAPNVWQLPFRFANDKILTSAYKTNTIRHFLSNQSNKKEKRISSAIHSDNHQHTSMHTLLFMYGRECEANASNPNALCLALFLYIYIYLSIYLYLCMIKFTEYTKCSVDDAWDNTHSLIHSLNCSFCSMRPTRLGNRMVVIVDFPSVCQFSFVRLLAAAATAASSFPIVLCAHSIQRTFFGTAVMLA